MNLHLNTWDSNASRSAMPEGTLAAKRIALFLHNQSFRSDPWSFLTPEEAESLVQSHKARKVLHSKAVQLLEPLEYARRDESARMGPRVMVAAALEQGKHKEIIAEWRDNQKGLYAKHVGTDPRGTA